MSQPVIIKSNKYGLHLILDRSLPFDELLDAVAGKFRESDKFFKDAKVAVSFEGRNLTQQEETMLIDTITGNTSLEILCVIDNDPKQEEHIRKQIELYQMSIQSPYLESGAHFYRGTLRSGQAIESEAGIVVVGDVNPGASVSANGSIVILGTVKGNVYAGLGGDESAFVVALDMDPIQIRIGSILAKSPDKPLRRRRRRRSAKETASPVPQIAFAKDGMICIEPLSKELLNDI